MCNKAVIKPLLIQNSDFAADTDRDLSEMIREGCALVSSPSLIDNFLKVFKKKD